MRNQNDHRDAKGGLRRLRRPRLVTYAAALAVLAAVPVAAGATSGSGAPAKPTGLQTFQLRKSDHPSTAGHVATFSRTPSFAWTPVRGATHYEFELSTSKKFGAVNAVIWSSKTLSTPAAAVPISLPWITGTDASLYWHVRAYGAGGVSRWSDNARFNMRWPDVWNRDNLGDVLGVPQWLPSEPGYVKWTPVEGATGYQVWFWNLGSSDAEGHAVSTGKIISTITTVADEREYVTGRPAGSRVVWRVRARRELYGSADNKLPRASYGPWSLLYTAQAGEAQASAPVAVPLRTVSSNTVLTPATVGSKSVGVVSDAESVRAHVNMPVFVWSRDSYTYHRVYVATDKDCVNIVFKGSVVSGTAFAPRISGPLALGSDSWDPSHSFLLDGDEGKSLMADGEDVISNETTKSADSGSTAPSKSEGPAHVDLWDSNWKTGRYYWTVVPVARRVSSDTPSNPPGATKTASSSSFQDLILPQDACQQDQLYPREQKHMLAFGKTSVNPQLANSSAPYVTGLTPKGRLLSAVNRQSRFYGVPLVAWTPASGAVAYDVEWSRTSYPWRPAGTQHTFSTSAMLPLAPGTWWYRIRGVDPYLVGNDKMSWSPLMRIQIAKPTFRVVGG